MKKLLKKVMSASLAATMVFGTAQLSLHASPFDFGIKASASTLTEDYYNSSKGYTFDEKSGTLSILSNDPHDYGDENILWDLVGKVKIINIGKNFSNTELLTNMICCYTNYAAEIRVDPENKNYCVYDKALYTTDKSKMIAYPCGNDDIDIILPKECTEISEHCFTDIGFLDNNGPRITGLKIPIRYDYSLYVSDKDQLESLFHTSSMMFSYERPFSKVYLDMTKEEIDELKCSNDIIAALEPESLSFVMMYAYLCNRYSGNKEVEDILSRYDTSAYTRESRTMLKRELQDKGYWDYTEPTFDDFNKVHGFETGYGFEEGTEGYQSYKENFTIWSQVFKQAYKYAISVFENYDVFKPMSEGCSGACGDDVFWSFDKSTGTITISGTGNMYDYPEENSPFFNNKAIQKVIIENGVTNIGAGMFIRCTDITDIDIPDSVAEIGTDAFVYCEALKNIALPKNISKINDFTFLFCLSLTDIEIPNSVKYIGAQAFAGCTGLTSISVPNSVTNLGAQAFAGCTGLISADIPDSITIIEPGLFQACTSLASIVISDNISSIGHEAFDGCIKLENIYIGKNCTEIGEEAFGEIPETAVICIASDTISIEKDTFEYTNPTFIVKDGSSAYQTLKDAGYKTIRYSLDRTFSETKKGEAKPVLSFLDELSSENCSSFNFVSQLILNNPNAAYVYFEKADYSSLVSDNLKIDTQSDSSYFKVSTTDADGDGESDTVTLIKAVHEKTFIEKVEDFFNNIIDFFKNSFNVIANWFKNL